MGRNETPLRYAVLTFAAAASVVILLELLLVLCGLADVIAYLCPLVIYTFGSDGLIFITPPCLIGLLVGFLAWLNRTLASMRNSYGRMITELKIQIRALEEKLDTKEKD